MTFQVGEGSLPQSRGRDDREYRQPRLCRQQERFCFPPFRRQPHRNGSLSHADHVGLRKVTRNGNWRP